jgi:methylmalonyl-CoA/ethylmalonyl-CoA epimerase
MDMSLAVGYWGGLQIEIVHQHNDGPSIYRTQQDTGDRAINHLGIFLDDLEPARAVVERSGSEIIQEMYVDGAGAMYVDVERTGTIVEYVLLPPYVADAFAALKAAADGWDGREVYVDLQ